jgi:hypothetical protein
MQSIICTGCLHRLMQLTQQIKGGTVKDLSINWIFINLPVSCSPSRQTDTAVSVMKTGGD